MNNNKSVLGIKTQVDLTQQSAYQWEKILLERPDYRDGWIQLSAIYFELGNKDKAKDAIVKAKELDPNNETILNLEKYLEE